VPLLVDEHILWLEVAIYNSALVDVVQSHQDLSGILPGSILCEPLRLPNLEEQVSALDELHHEEERRCHLGVGVSIQFYDEWRSSSRVQGLHYLQLLAGLIDVLFIVFAILASRVFDFLHGVGPTRILLALNEVDRAIGPLSDGSYEFEASGKFGSLIVD